MAKGIVRKLDHLGRIDIPIEYRRSLKYAEQEGLDLYIESNVIHLKKGQGRRIDKVGRYVIPKEVRTTLSFGERQELDIFIVGDELCIQKVGCEWCNASDNLIEIEGHLLCREHVHKVSSYWNDYKDSTIKVGRHYDAS